MEHAHETRVAVTPSDGPAASAARFLPMAVPLMGDREVGLVSNAVSTGWISSQGQFVREFEDLFASFSGANYGIAVTSGTTALHLALAVAGIGPGDEVILPPITHIACINAIRFAGATPVLADVERDTWCIDPDAVAAKVTVRTKAVMPVHLFGHPCDMDPLVELASRRGFLVIDDAAEAHGAEYKGRRVGGIGDIACFSFYANKIITTGEGGMVVTDDESLATRARKLRDQAYEQERRFMHYELGFNYRMTNVQAAIGVAQMERIDEFVETHRRNAELFSELLAETDGVELPREADWAKHVYWMYSVLLEDEHTREVVAARLKEAAIDTRPFFFPLHWQPLYEELFAGESYPVAEEIARRGISVPSGNELGAEDVRRIAGALIDAVGECGQ